MSARRGCDEVTKRMKAEDNETEEDEERVVRLTCNSERYKQVLTKQRHDKKKNITSGTQKETKDRYADE